MLQQKLSLQLWTAFGTQQRIDGKIWDIADVAMFKAISHMCFSFLTFLY